MKRSTILISTLITSSILLFLSFLTKDIGAIGNAVFISFFLILIPQSLLSYREHRRIKEMEEKFPEFLRDLIGNLRSKIPFYKAILIASKYEYGALTPEIRKMANQLSWGIPLDKVLNNFSKRIRKKSKRIAFSVSLINATFKSGGDIISVLDNLAENLVMLREVEKDRKSVFAPYVVLMYAISIVFVFIIVVLNKLMLPIIGKFGAVPGQTFLGNPCGLADTLLTVGICGLYDKIAGFFGLPVETPVSYYFSIFFLLAILQSFFCGLMAGEISENSIIVGLKHALILVTITFVSFSIMIRVGVFA